MIRVGTAIEAQERARRATSTLLGRPATIGSPKQAAKSAREVSHGTQRGSSASKARAPRGVLAAGIRRFAERTDWLGPDLAPTRRAASNAQTEPTRLLLSSDLVAYCGSLVA